jgi:hypothetical protein
MDLASRYEILDTIASGDFATVLRARDRELGREVAIKQIHRQFLADQQQLARYWREAQLLASLQHPNILTIYDIVRPRGWLILELMQGSLKHRAEGQPLDLDSLRIVLAAGLSALHFLHTNGVIHGDVKPGNLLYDAQNRIKLGDFGLARRASSEEGSLLKGTTKYMAPELVAEQFGTVGPASDLYSLGFSAYELMCGSQFEALFPGLGSFGRDKQIAWMMWHAAPDRRLPEIGRVLEGVPDDLARVIQKLVAKDQSRRYQSAQEVLHDLASGPPVIERPAEEEDPKAAAARAAAARRKRRLRLVAVLAVAVSLALCVPMLFWGEKPPPVIRGVIAEVNPEEWKLALASSQSGRVQEVSFTRYDRFLVNGEPARLRDLRRDDQIVVSRVRDEALGRWITEVRAIRPKTYSGRIKTITRPTPGGQRQFLLAIGPLDPQVGELSVSVPEGIEILLNGEKEIGGRPVEAGDLKVGDRVLVQHIGQRSGRKAIKLAAQRVIPESGIICSDVAKNQDPLRVEVGEGNDRRVRVFPFADDCRVTINDQPSKAPTDLRQGDQVTFQHDTRVVSVDAHRTIHDAGRIEQVHADRLEVTLKGQHVASVCLVGSKCKLTLFGEPVELTALRRGDDVEITHDSLNRENLKPTEIAAVRPADPTRWAILVGIQNYADRALTRLAHPVGDATLLREVMVKRYWVPDTQALLLLDESLARLKDRTRQQLRKIGTDGKLLVYFAGHAYEDPQGQVYLAPKDFQLARMGTTGLPLQWLVDELEKCPAGQKLLLLDCSHAYPQAGSRQAGAPGADLTMQPSTAEMLATLKGPPGWAPLRSVTAVASCSAGQRGLSLPGTWTMPPPVSGYPAAGSDQGHGLFAWSLAWGYSGSADKDRDGRIDTAELVAFLKQQMTSAGKQLGASQTPVLFAADNRPPRLSEEAKENITKLAEHLQHERIDFDAVDQQYAATVQAAGAEPEPKLLYALLLLKGKRREDARQQFAALKSERPDWLIPLQGTAWAWFDERGYTAGLSELRELVSKISKPGSAPEPYPPHVGKLWAWTGQLRQFAEIAAGRGFRVPPQSLADLDAAVAALGGPAQSSYQQGREQSRQRKQQIETRAEDAKQAGNVASATQLLTVERYRLQQYAVFPFDDALKQIAGGLDQRAPRY